MADKWQTAAVALPAAFAFRSAFVPLFYLRRHIFPFQFYPFDGSCPQRLWAKGVISVSLQSKRFEYLPEQLHKDDLADQQKGID